MRLRTLLIAIPLTLILAAGLSSARVTHRDGKDITRPERVMVLDGSPVHDVGQLLLHTGNWGGVGSWPGASIPFSVAPSAEWPAGSGVEYLFAGGLWVGGMVDGIPAVSTAALTFEFRPTQDPLDIVYRSREGAPGGKRMPSPQANDDGDGEINEDRLDGHDNDGDGMIDEDFAGISDQMFSRWYTDDQPEALLSFPDHRPLHIEVFEKSYQWTDPEFDDFVGFDFVIKNIGFDTIDDVYIGYFLDGDAGSRSTDYYWEDDRARLRRVSAECTEYGAVSYDYAYIVDDDGDNGTTTGAFGVVFLNHPTDPTGEYAPRKVGFTTYANMSGSQSFADGGDPTNDFERYELMSANSIERDGLIPRDYRMLVSVGPFKELSPGQTIKFSMALVATPRDDFTNVANAVVAYNGKWFDADGDPQTGILGRETPVPGPVTVIVDPCLPPFDQPIDWNSREPIWINTDCEREAFFKNACGYDETEAHLFRTGVGGRETQVHWLLPSFVPEPEPFVARVRITPRTVNLKSNGDPLNAHLTLPEGYSAEDVDEGSLRLNETIPGHIVSIESDGTIHARFSRKQLQQMARAGDMECRVSGMAAGEPFLAMDVIKIVGGDAPILSESAPVAKTRLSHSPNPFNPSARIVFELAVPGDISLDIFSPDGKRVRALASGYHGAGVHEATWDGRNSIGAPVRSGIYFYRLVTGSETITNKMVLVK